jgi:hypothetical protein
MELRTGFCVEMPRSGNTENLAVWRRKPSASRYGSIAAPAILHTSTNTPAIILALSVELMAAARVMHMGLILVSVYLVFLVRAGAASSSGRAALT